MWMNLKNLMLSYKRWTQKCMYHRIALTWNSRKKKSVYSAQKQSSLRLRVWGMERRTTSMGHKGTLWWDRNILYSHGGASYTGVSICLNLLKCTRKILCILLFINYTSIKWSGGKKEAEQIIVIPACSDTSLHKSFADCNHSCSATASGTGLQSAKCSPTWEHQSWWRDHISTLVWRIWYIPWP